MNNPKARHILNLSGGKDSTALAVFMRDKIPEMEYVFCDTGCELPETYEYLDRIESFLGKKVIRLNSEKSFDYWLNVYSGFLPSPRSRWCTKVLKIQPFERYVGEDLVYSYIGIRADEDREGYISSKENIKPVYPFKDAGIDKKGVYALLNTGGLGLPKYYEWRSRSGCYFCFFQRSSEWVGLLEEHPDLFSRAKTYEKVDNDTGRGFTWVQGSTLIRIEKEKDRIKERAEKGKNIIGGKKTLYEQFDEFSLPKDEDEGQDEACMICHL